MFDVFQIKQLKKPFSLLIIWNLTTNLNLSLFLIFKEKCSLCGAPFPSNLSYSYRGYPYEGLKSHSFIDSQLH